MKPIRTTEFTVYLDQRPGELAGLLDAAASAGVDVRAISVSEHNGKGLVRVVGDPVERLRAVCESLMESGVGPIVESDVLSVSIENRPNALRDLATAMADQRINLRYAYLAPRQADRPTLCVFRVDDPEEVAAKIEAIDWPSGD
jgi:hypothetical protein